MKIKSAIISTWGLFFQGRRFLLRDRHSPLLDVSGVVMVDLKVWYSWSCYFLKCDYSSSNLFVRAAYLFGIPPGPRKAEGWEVNFFCPFHLLSFNLSIVIFLSQGIIYPAYTFAFLLMVSAFILSLHYWEIFQILHLYISDCRTLPSSRHQFPRMGKAGGSIFFVVSVLVLTFLEFVLLKLFFIQPYFIRQAKARQAVIANGGEVEWGKHYSNTSSIKFAKESVGQNPSVETDWCAKSSLSSKDSFSKMLTISL